MKRHPLHQKAIDELIATAAQARMELGPDCDTVFILGKALNTLMTDRGRAKSKRRIKGKLANGEPVTLDASLIERSEDADD